MWSGHLSFIMEKVREVNMRVPFHYNEIRLIWDRWIDGSCFHILLPACLRWWFTQKQMGLNSIRTSAPSAHISPTQRTPITSTAAFRADSIKLIWGLYWFCSVNASSWRAEASVHLLCKMQSFLHGNYQVQIQHIDNSSDERARTADSCCALRLTCTVCQWEHWFLAF